MALSKSRRLPLPRLAITMGDPSGIGPEVIVKALAKPMVWRCCRPLVLGSVPIIEQAAQYAGVALKTTPLEDPPDPSRPWNFRQGSLPIFDPFPRPLGRLRPGRASARSGAAAVTCIATAARWAQLGLVDGMVTAPINKQAIHLAGYAFPGHTEMLAAFSQVKDTGMLILGGPLKIFFVTTHVAIRDLPQAITAARVLRTIRLAHQGLQTLFRCPRPRIGVAGLNPHAGEEGLFGLEERRAIGPAVGRARAAGIQCSGPHPADTLFGKAIHGEYDGVVAMYHDQGLVALKTVAFGRCVNITVGLPFIRTSVDHGTAYDIAGKGVADPSSLLEAISLATQLVSTSRR